MNIKANAVVGSTGNNSVNLSNGFYGGSISLQGNIVIGGITTVGILSSTSLVTTTINVNSLSGNGSGLTNVPNIQTSRVIALKYIFADPPLRA